MSDHHTLIKQLACALLILQRLLDSERLAPVVEALSLVAMAPSTQKAVQVCPCALFIVSTVWRAVTLHKTQAFDLRAVN